MTGTHHNIAPLMINKICGNLW